MVHQQAGPLPVVFVFRKERPATLHWHTKFAVAGSAGGARAAPPRDSGSVGWLLWLAGQEKEKAKHRGVCQTNL